MKLRVYDNKGRERWLSAGSIVPTGWFDSKCQEITSEKIVMPQEEQGNPYDERSRSSYSLILVDK